jgi:hypothetical protein
MPKSFEETIEGSTTLIEFQTITENLKERLDRLETELNKVKSGIIDSEVINLKFENLENKDDTIIDLLKAIGKGFCRGIFFVISLLLGIAGFLIIKIFFP